MCGADVSEIAAKPAARLSDAVNGNPQSSLAAPIVGVIPGEGIGAEVIAASLELVGALREAAGLEIEIRVGGAIGRQAVSLGGKSLTAEVTEFCAGVFADGGAVLCGPGGARFVYDLRRSFDLFCKLTPLQPLGCLGDIGAVRPELLRGVDIVAVRENLGGLYFGESRIRPTPDGLSAEHTYGYSSAQIDRILAVSARLAKSRRGRLCVVVKRDGVPAVSELWLARLEQMDAAAGLQIEVLDVDNAVYQLIARPREFDVVVSPNMFGDVLADCGALLLGSRGLSHSANFGPAGAAVYQTGHGAAYDIAGQDRANPVGQMLALAMLLEESLNSPRAAGLIRHSIRLTLSRGLRTADMGSGGSRLDGTRELTAGIVEQLKELAGGLVCARH